MCGLFAHVSKDHWNPLTKFKFEILGVAMDDRGGDGTGIAYDGVVDKGAIPKKFDDFWRMDRVPDTLVHNAIIGHDRKASVGAQTYENTQPIFFENLNTVLAHNGTIYNFEEMYKAHKVKDHFDYNIVGMSDSQVMGLLMEKSGWPVLNEYIGSMAFLYMRDDEPGVIYAFHGKSALRNTAAVTTEERPLYYAIHEGETWLCSTKTALEKIIKDKDVIKELPFNIVYRFDGDTMSNVFEADRSKSTQMENWDQPATQSWNQSGRGYNDEDYTQAEWYKEAFPKKEKKAYSWDNKDILKDTYAYPGKNQMYWEAGFYKSNGELLNGIIRCSPSGIVIRPDDTSYKYFYCFCFYHGNMLRGSEEYIQLLQTINTPKFMTALPMVKLWMLGKFFANPFLVAPSNQADKTFVYSPTPNESGLSCNLFSGTIPVPFCAKEIIIKNGRMEKSSTGEYASIGSISKWSIDPNFTITEEDMDKFLQQDCGDKCDNGIKDNPTYECPICLGWGELLNPGGEDIICPACGGATTISREDLFAYMEERMGDPTASLVDVKDEHDTEKIISMIDWITDLGLEILEKNISIKGVDLEERIHEIKQILWST